MNSSVSNSENQNQSLLSIEYSGKKEKKKQKDIIKESKSKKEKLIKDLEKKQKVFHY
jgi:hypothetical protein